MAEENKKIKVGWFSFSCCEDSTVVFTEILNDHWQEWKHILDFRHARVLKSKNVMDEFDVAFIEGAIASDDHEAKVKEIRSRSKIVVAVGACACIGMPSAQRNRFTAEQMQEVQFLVDRFKMLPKVLKLADVIKVDYEVPGCPMSPDDFLTKLGIVVKELQSAKQ
jgi:coenzyme F420-reducing hydrogenase gamma subunit